MFKSALLVFCLSILLQSCSSSPLKHQSKPNVTSNPSNATVYANLLEIGKTPLRKNLYDVFPAGWDNLIYQAQGVLVIKKNGCKDFTLKVSDYILSKPIHADMECTDTVNAGEMSPEKSQDTPAITAAPRSETEKRLDELENLFKKGMISKDEYEKNRERILSEI